ncbi:Ubiquitin-conjugating enzyme E2 J2 [Myotis brandtii]|uniref:Ubiquitin-conjugating enzyme E2 J2 n=1 Tax=Myotis brandtii TaxID=109478 RepID=S7N1J7_MYOBR|nr:Ubiquitin-conjugating enzyme E2 J2 [Myotis brandtii]
MSLLPKLRGPWALESPKRQLAAQSLVFNLKDKVFCELFPEVVEEIKQKQKAQDELSSRPQALPLPDVVPDGDTHHGQHGLQLLNGKAGQPAPRTPGRRPGELVCYSWVCSLCLHGQVCAEKHSTGVSCTPDRGGRERGTAEPDAGWLDAPSAQGGPARRLGLAF